MTPKDIISLICTCGSLFLAAYIANKNNIKEGTSNITTLGMKMDSLLQMMTEMKARQESADRMQREDHDALIKMDQSIRSAWKVIDEIKREHHGETKEE